jgi:hypothetical protein
VFLADSLDDAYDLAEKIIENYDYPALKSYFNENYYDKLLSLVDEKT